MCLNVLIFLFNDVLITFWVVNLEKSQEIELELLSGDELGGLAEWLMRSAWKFIQI